MRYVPGIVTGICLLLTSSAAAQSALELNRSGRFAEAAEVAGRVVAEEDTSLRERCEAYTNLIYAEIRLGQYDSAAEHLSAYDEAACADVLESGYVAEVDRLRAILQPPTPSTDDDWEVAEAPTATRLDPDILTEHEALCERSAADACLVVHNGQIVQEYYGDKYQQPMYAMSTTKSITGLLAGMLIGDGKLSLDDPVSKYIPEWKAGAEAGVTMHHLLTMTSGLPDFPPGVPEVGTVSDKEAFVFGLQLVARPGEVWAYSNDGAFLLSPLLDRAAGEPIEDYARRRLFEPLGMQNTRFHVYPDGQAWTHADLETTPRDLARIGLLMLNGGRWEGEQIVPESWVEASVTPIPQKPDYGLLWWIHDDPKGYAGHGYLDTHLHVFPAMNLIVVRMQSKPTQGAEPYEPASLRLFRRIQMK